VALGNPPNLQLQNFSIEAWIKRSSNSIISYGTDGGGNFMAYGNGGYAFYLGGNAHLYFGKVGTVALPGSAVITDTNFHHVAVTKSNTVVTFYIDGAVDTSISFGETFTFTKPVVIGAQFDDLGNDSFFGRIDELSVYNRPLTTAEIQGIYSAGASGKCVTNTAPSILTQPTNNSAFSGTAISFSVAAAGTSPLTYQWIFNGTNDLLGQTTSSLPLANVQSSNAGNYSVTVSNAFGSITSSIATLTVLTPSSVPLFNVDFASGVPIKTGFAATGQAPTDYWNAFTSLDGIPLNVKQADGAPCGHWLTARTFLNRANWMRPALRCRHRITFH